MNVFEAVKQSVTTRQAAEHYGIHVGRNGMACCPFHNDKTPSMKLDRRYHCFGCGADGDVIDFAAALYGLRKKEAAVQLAQDFGLSYEDWKPPGKEKKPKPRQKSPEEQFQEAKNRCFRILADYLHLLMAWRKDYAPHSPEEAFHPRFVEALQKQAQVEYLLDMLKKIVLFPISLFVAFLALMARWLLTLSSYVVAPLMLYIFGCGIYTAYRQTWNQFLILLVAEFLCFVLFFGATAITEGIGRFSEWLAEL